MRKPTEQPQPLASLAEVARKLNLPFHRAKTLVTERVIVPDFTSQGRSFFHPHRIPQLRDLIQL